MIARHWRGWTEIGNADAYEKLLSERVLPGLKRIAGYKGGYVFRHDDRELGQSEFVVVNFFSSLEAVKEFAGPDYNVSVFEPEAKRLLSKIEPVAMHYEVRIRTV